ncbi:alpha/beta fold hydrolase [Candidatus Microgenomates bacterium]|nr:alpha/beta fold hydrolase [Candidatus Microgenomates bacterium]
MELSYFELGEACLRRQGEKNIVLIHGWAVDKEKFRPLARDLVKKGWHVLAVDLPGFGKSFKPEIPLTTDGYKTVISNFVKDKWGNLPYIVFGHSFGGRVATALALGDKNVRGLVICSSTVSSPSSLKHFFYKLLGGMLIWFPNIRKWVLSHYYEMPSGFWNRLILRSIRSGDNYYNLGKLAMPVLILWGGSDKILPPALAYQTKAQISKSILKVFKNIGHSLPYHRPAAIAGEIDMWAKTFLKV